MKKKTLDIITYLVLTLFSLGILLPILWIFRTSLAPRLISYKIPPDWLFRPTFSNYLDLAEMYEFLKYLSNSFFIAGSATLIIIPLASLAAYSFIRFRTGGESLRWAILGTQMLPPIVLALPLFVIFKYLNLIDRHLGLTLVYTSFNLPLAIWILMGFFEDIPVELEEAALIDGASPLQTFARIVFPLGAPGIMATGILNFILCWNEFLFALILTGDKSGTVPVILAAMQTERGVMWGVLASGTILAIAPMVLISFFVRKYLVRGLTFGALK